MLWPTRMRDFWATEPFEELRRLHREMDRLFGGLWPLREAPAFPPVNLWTGRDDVVVTAELPGVDPSGLDITVLGDTLTISGSRPAPELPEGGNFDRQERFAGNFSRRVQLPYRVDPDKVEATYSKGILEVRLPRHEADKPKQIAVKASK